MSARHVVLVGPMGSGKSVVGRALARRMGRDNVDLDQEVEATAGRTIAEIFADDGEDGFRAIETSALRHALSGDPAVISTGGGIVLDEANRAMLGDGRATVVWLDAEIDTLVRRVGEARGRPLLEGDVRSNLNRTVHDRAALYQEVGDIDVDTTSLRPDAVVDRITAALEREVTT